MVLGKKNKVYTLGNNEFGQLGIKEDISFWVKLQELDFFAEKDYLHIKRVKANHNLSYVIDNQNEIYIWGKLNDKSSSFRYIIILKTL